jgi:hypothetical protein
MLPFTIHFLSAPKGLLINTPFKGLQCEEGWLIVNGESSLSHHSRLTSIFLAVVFLKKDCEFTLNQLKSQSKIILTGSSQTLTGIDLAVTVNFLCHRLLK